LGVGPKSFFAPALKGENFLWVQNPKG